MLTTDLLKSRIRGNRIYPQFIQTDDPALRNLVSMMLATANANSGAILRDFEQNLQACAGHPLFPGLKKTLLRFVVDNDEDEIESRSECRMEVILKAQVLRREQLFETRAAYAETLAQVCDQPFAKIVDDLYADLPEQQPVVFPDGLTIDHVIDRYNCAQVQGLLLRAHALEVVVEKASVEEKRVLFRAIKFHRLIAEVRDDENGFMWIKIDGPLSLFEKVQAYGMRVANFFPRILHCAKWAVTAQIDYKGKRLDLLLTHRDGLRSIYAPQGAYIPKELATFLQSFNLVASDWTAQVGNEFLHLGRQSYCFPDFTMVHKKTGNRVHLELFHRWHKGQLLQRLDAMRADPARTPLVIGVCRSLAKTDKIAAPLAEVKGTLIKTLVFSEFPTSSAIADLLRTSPNSVL